MRPNYLRFLFGILAFCVLSVSAQEVAISISPAPGDYKTLPTEFTLSFDGPKSIAKNISAGGNPLLIISPSGARLQIAGTFSGTVMTCRIPESATLPLDEKGDYTVQLRDNVINYTWADGTKTKSAMVEYVYTVEGKEEENPDVPDVPKDVVYDIEFQKTIPNLQPFDLAEGNEIGILQLYFNMGNLQIGNSAAARVTITGPDYEHSAVLQPNMNMKTSTVFKISMPTPKYSGTYTLTIPQGVLGDEEWIKDPRYGHANAEVNYEFTMIHGLSSETVSVSISPLPGQYDTLPDEFTLTIDGPVAIEGNVAGGNPILVTSPKGQKQQLTGDFTGNTIICKVPASFPRDQRGDYTVQLREDAVDYTWADGSKSRSTIEEYVYNVIGKEEELPDEPKEVAYDIEMNKTIPNLRPLDLEMYGIETLQLYFNRPDLQIDPRADAIVTITGPNYYNCVQLVKVDMLMPAATVFKALFNDPKYSGTYTLTVPQGILGDEVWIKDHKMGHANAEVVYEFTVTNGDDPSTITRDLTFNPRVTPSSGAKVSDLSSVLLTFGSKPYWDPEAEIDVYYRADLSEDGVDTSFGKAKISQGEGNNLILTFTSTPRSTGQYKLTLPEGIFWNGEHETDAEAGALNCELSFNWYLVGGSVDLEVTGHVPATDAYLGCFPVDKECIVIMTNMRNEAVSADIELIEYKLDDDMAAPMMLLNTTTTDVNDEGYVCWINRTGADIELLTGCYYEVVYTLRNASGNILTDGSFEFYGDMSTGINEIRDEAGKRIYNLQGIEVTGETLPAGMYIIDGKKIVIR